ncbi:HET-domain-containing protein, partial [Setomelanomma holmii]
PTTLSQMDAWINECNENHVKCAQSMAHRPAPLPSRVLDLTSLPTRQDMLSDRTDWRGTGRYIALSYCWGRSLAYTTTISNQAMHKQDNGIAFASLPRTLQDALLLTRYLGLDYIWADCLCIVQDDKADWEYEAARMSEVYSNAYLSLAATRASHCDEGFLQDRKVKAGDMVRLKNSEGAFDLYFEYNDCTMSPGSMETLTRVKDEPLLGRVWCFQERVLANRTLNLASDQMYWECAAAFAEEGGTVNSSNDDHYFYKEYSLQTVIDDLKDHTKRGDAWYRMVQEYTSRNITYQTDKLPAFSGIASALQEVTGDEYYAGLWKSWFLEGLLWRLQIPSSDIYVFVPKEPQRLDFWRAPSWSFAALEG